jgi:hypothetical protein
MQNLGLSLVALFAALSLTAGAAGCTTESADAPPVATDQATAEALATASAPHLSQDLLCAAVKAADDYNNTSPGPKLVAIPESKLNSDALHDFKAWQRNMLPDYPSEAFELPVKLAGKTYSFILVVENNDGGGAIGVYRTDGSVVASDMYSESEGNPWSSPADKCPDEQ